ncbi:hypothetical protein [Spirulina sp. 06S082]|nr:hypothetical protein [Spirulina sp. 06S082]
MNLFILVRVEIIVREARSPISSANYCINIETKETRESGHVIL